MAKALAATLAAVLLFSGPVRAVSSGPVVHGGGSWYLWHPGEAAAGPALRAALGHWRGVAVKVLRVERLWPPTFHIEAVRLTDWCGCPGGRVIDLDSRTFAHFAPLSRGVVQVWVGA